MSSPRMVIDFSHRLSYASTTPTTGLADSVDLMAARALGVLYLLSSQVEAEGNDFMCNAIDSVICELKDIKMLAEAYAAAAEGGES